MAEKDVDSKGDAGKDVDSKGDAGKDVDSKGDGADAAKDVDSKTGPYAQAELVDGIMNRAAALGGWLIVSIVSPLQPDGRRFANRGTAPSSAVTNAAERSRKRQPPVAPGLEPAVQPDSYSQTKPGVPK